MSRPARHDTAKLDRTVRDSTLEPTRTMPLNRHATEPICRLAPPTRAAAAEWARASSSEGASSVPQWHRSRLKVASVTRGLRAPRKLLRNQNAGIYLWLPPPKERQRSRSSPIPPDDPGGRGRLLSRPPYPPFGSQVHLQVSKWLFRDQISAEVTIVCAHRPRSRVSESAMFKETHPILGTRDIQRAIEFYTRQLGFKLSFRDEDDPPNYVGFAATRSSSTCSFSSSTKWGPSACAEKARQSS
jgi:Glyoxalase/Bleomycin resistance protein/Dioxygenase superfamily